MISPVSSLGRNRAVAPSQRFAVEMVRSGRIGPVHSVNVEVGGSPRFVYDLCEERQDTFDWDRWVGPPVIQPYTTFIAPLDPVASGWAQWRQHSDFGEGGIETTRNLVGKRSNGGIGSCRHVEKVR